MFFLINVVSRFLKPNILTEAIIVKNNFSIWGPGVSWGISIGIIVEEILNICLALPMVTCGLWESQEALLSL